MINIYSDIITDKQFDKLLEIKALNIIQIRNSEIKKKFKDLRVTMRVEPAIEQIRKEYPYIQYDTIKKIVYYKNKSA